MTTDEIYPKICKAYRGGYAEVIVSAADWRYLNKNTTMKVGEDHKSWYLIFGDMTDIMKIRPAEYPLQRTGVLDLSKE